MIVPQPFLYPYGKRPPPAFSSTQKGSLSFKLIVVRKVAAPPAARTSRATPTVRLHKEELNWMAETLHLKPNPTSKGAPMLAQAHGGCRTLKKPRRGPPPA